MSKELQKQTPPLASYEPAAVRGIDESTWLAAKNTLFPGCKDESVVLAFDYCKARQLDIMMKPVHITSMSVYDQASGKYRKQDVVMPGVGLYRIQASRSGDYAGCDEPEFGPKIQLTLTDKAGNSETIAVPQWCRYTVYKMVQGQRVAFTALEYWEENYATQGNNSSAPNSMWRKRRYGQLAKCAEAQALRRAWPEIGQEPTYEEMAGKAMVKDVEGSRSATERLGINEQSHPQAQEQEGQWEPREAQEPQPITQAQVADELKKAKTPQDLQRVADMAMELPEQHRDELRSQWEAKRKELAAQSQSDSNAE